MIFESGFPCKASQSGTVYKMRISEKNCKRLANATQKSDWIDVCAKPNNTQSFIHCLPSHSQASAISSASQSNTNNTSVIPSASQSLIVSKYTSSHLNSLEMQPYIMNLAINNLDCTDMKLNNFTVKMKKFSEETKNILLIVEKLKCLSILLISRYIDVFHNVYINNRICSSAKEYWSRNPLHFVSQFDEDISLNSLTPDLVRKRLQHLNRKCMIGVRNYCRAQNVDPPTSVKDFWLKYNYIDVEWFKNVKPNSITDFMEHIIDTSKPYEQTRS